MTKTQPMHFTRPIAWLVEHVLYGNDSMLANNSYFLEGDAIVFHGDSWDEFDWKSHRVEFFIHSSDPDTIESLKDVNEEELCELACKLQKIFDVTPYGNCSMKASVFPIVGSSMRLGIIGAEDSYAPGVEAEFVLFDSARTHEFVRACWMIVEDMHSYEHVNTMDNGGDIVSNWNNLVQKWYFAKKEG